MIACCEESAILLPHAVAIVSAACLLLASNCEESVRVRENPGGAHAYVLRRVLYKPSSLSEVPHELSDATSAVCSRKAGPAQHVCMPAPPALYKPSSLSETSHELSDATSAVCSRKAGPAQHVCMLFPPMLYRPSSLSEVPHELSDVTSAVCSRKAGPAQYVYMPSPPGVSSSHTWCGAKSRIIC